MGEAADERDLGTASAAASPVAAEREHKRVAYVELYLDLVFVLAVGRLALVVVDDPRLRSVWIAFGLFQTLWWTWVGFAVLYNRGDGEDRRQRLKLLAASVPIGVAAVEIGSVVEGDVTVFALALALVRLIIGSAYADAPAVRETSGRPRLSAFRERITRAYGLSALLFALSPLAPAPWFGLVWAVAISIESGAMLREDRDAMRRARHDRDFSALANADVDPEEALDPHHFAERFALFVIILLGEVVVEAGQSGAEHRPVLAAAMVLAAALWWLYFDAAVDRNLAVLERFGGSPTMARAVYATGHIIPCFSLLLIAAGVGLLLEAEDPPQLARTLVSVGLGFYLLRTKVFLAGVGRVDGALRVLLLIATFTLARLPLDPGTYVVVIAAWAVGCAALTARRRPPRELRALAVKGGSPPPGSPSDPAPSDAARRP